MNKKLVELCQEFNNASEKLHELMVAEHRDEDAIWRAEVDVRLSQTKLEEHLAKQSKK